MRYPVSTARTVVKQRPLAYINFRLLRCPHKGRHEVLEGPATEDIIILEFPSYEADEAWYHSPAYQAASSHRFQGRDYRCILTEGVAASHD